MKLSPFFSRSEFKCKCDNPQCNFDTVDSETLMVITAVRERFNEPVTINSACRCYEHNKAVGGASRSYHLQGRACDIVVKNVTPQEVFEYLDMTWPNQYGFGLYETFVHVDTRTGNKWRK